MYYNDPESDDNNYLSDEGDEYKESDPYTQREWIFEDAAKLQKRYNDRMITEQRHSFLVGQTVGKSDEHHSHMAISDGEDDDWVETYAASQKCSHAEYNQGIQDDNNECIHSIQDDSNEYKVKGDILSPASMASTVHTAVSEADTGDDCRMTKATFLQFGHDGNNVDDVNVNYLGQEWNVGVGKSVESDDDAFTHDSSNQFYHESTGTLSDNDDSNSQAISIDLAVYTQQEQEHAGAIMEPTESNSNVATSAKGDEENDRKTVSRHSPHSFSDDTNGKSCNPPSLMQRVCSMANHQKPSKSEKSCNNEDDGHSGHVVRVDCRSNHQDSMISQERMNSADETATAAATMSTELNQSFIEISSRRSSRSPSKSVPSSSSRPVNTEHIDMNTDLNTELNTDMTTEISNEIIHTFPDNQQRLTQSYKDNYVDSVDNSDSLDDVLQNIYETKNTICRVLGIEKTTHCSIHDNLDAIDTPVWDTPSSPRYLLYSVVIYI